MEWLQNNSASKDFPQKSAYIYRKILDYSRLLMQVEKRALIDVKKMCQGKEDRRFIEGFPLATAKHVELDNRSLEDFYRLCCRQGNIAVSNPKLTDLEKKAQAIIPKRLKKGPFPFDYFERQLGEGIGWYFKNRDKIGGSRDNKMYEVLNLCDGKRSALIIRDIISLEFGEADIEFVLHLLADLKQTGLATFKTN